MNTPISPETAEMIKKDAEAYMHSAVRDIDEDILPCHLRFAYEAGATTYAPYKEQFQQAKKALERIRDCAVPYTELEAWSWVYTARQIVLDTLATWKEAGKEGGV